jgi:hypothetical protein
MRRQNAEKQFGEWVWLALLDFFARDDGKRAWPGMATLSAPSEIGRTHGPESWAHYAAGGETGRIRVCAARRISFATVLDAKLAVQFAAYGGDGGRAEFQFACRNCIITAVADDGQHHFLEFREKPE